MQNEVRKQRERDGWGKLNRLESELRHSKAETQFLLETTDELHAREILDLKRDLTQLSSILQGGPMQLSSMLKIRQRQISNFSGIKTAQLWMPSRTISSNLRMTSIAPILGWEKQMKVERRDPKRTQT